LKILVIDDDPNSQEVLSDILSFAGMVVEIAATGEDAITLLHGNRYDGILVDFKLPGIDGWEFLATIKAIVTTPCIAITVYDNATMQDDAMQAGFDGYFAKPVNELTFAQDLMHLLT